MEVIGTEIASSFSPAANQISASAYGRIGRSGTSATTRIEPTVVSTLASLVVTHFRAHGHVNNVMTHISGARWDRIEDELCIILDTENKGPKLTPLAENLVELLYAERCVTGRIVKPYFEALLAGLLPAGVAIEISAHIECLYRAAEDGAKHDGRPVGSAPEWRRRKNARLSKEKAEQR